MPWVFIGLFIAACNILLMTYAGVYLYTIFATILGIALMAVGLYEVISEEWPHKTRDTR